MTITQAVTFLRNEMRNGTDTSKYTAAKVEQAIMGIGDDFVGRTRATRTIDTVSLTPGTATYSFVIAYFRPEYLLRAYISDLTNATSDGNPPGLSVTEFQTVYDKVINLGASSQPTEIGFSSMSSFGVYPIPFIAHTLSFQWDPPFTSWTAGSGGSTVLNLPDEYLRNILRWGGTYFAQGNEPEHAKTGAINWQNYLDFVNRLKGQGAGTLGKQIEYRVPLRGIPGTRPRRTIIDNLYQN